MAKQVKEKEKKEEKSTLEKLYESLNNIYGAGTIMGGRGPEADVGAISSGSISLDLATNLGGIPVGKLIEMIGLESSGKSTMALHFIAEFQKAGRRCALCDAEHSFDRKYATTIGVKADDLVFIEPNNMEAGYNIVQKFVESGEFGLIIIDSHTALLPKKVVDGIVGDATIGLQARLNSIFLGKVHPYLKRNKCTIVAISQLRTDIGAYNPNPQAGPTRIATGGLAYKFYSDMRLKVRREIKKEDEQNKTVVEVIKSKCGAPFGQAEFRITWGEGIDRAQEVIDYAVEYKILIYGGGGWYTLEDGSKIQGDETMKDMMRDNPEYAKQLEDKVMAKIKGEDG